MHFPSPPNEALGITMPLVSGLPAVKEVIHAPLKGDINAQSCIGRLGHIAQALIPEDNAKENNLWLENCRKAHAEQLNDHYATQPVNHWLNRHGLTE